MGKFLSGWAAGIHTQKLGAKNQNSANRRVQLCFVDHFRYHHYRNIPSQGVFVKCFQERNNRLDPHAVVIRTMQVIVGRLPAGLSRIMYCNGVETVWCIYTGRMRHDGPVRGGGPKLICFYVVEINIEETLLTNANLVSQYVDENSMFL